MARAKHREENNEGLLLRSAAIAAVLIIAVVFITFTKSNPFADPFEMRGVFSSPNQLRPGTQVRIAGHEIGKVTEVGKGPANQTLVTMQIDREEEDLRADARLAVEPRLFFEGNFYVNVSPGTPAAPRMRDGATVPSSRTSVPVQLDQVLTTFTAPTRAGLQRAIGELNDGLGGAAPGYAGLREAARELDRSLPSYTRFAASLQGRRAGDLRRAIRDSGAVTAQFADNPAALADFVTHFDRTFGALAAEDRALAASIRSLDGVMRVAPRSLTRIDAALPVLTSFARALQPTMAALPATLRKTNRLLEQIAGLVGAGELPALLNVLRPATRSLPTLQRRLVPLFRLVAPLMSCVSRNVVPTLNQEVPDGHLSTGYPVWQDLVHTTTALAGTSPAFDGNGTTIRLGVTQGEGALRGFLPGVGEVQASQRVAGVRPTWLGPGVNPSFRPDVPCRTQDLPDLSKRAGGPPAGFEPADVGELTPKALEAKKLIAQALERSRGGSDG